MLYIIKKEVELFYKTYLKKSISLFTDTVVT